MREILFRGKRLDNGEWAEGDLIKHGSDCFVIPFFGISNTEEQENKTCDTLVYLQAHKVDPETVCQYTGLTDKNGRKIFEGDIVKAEISINDFSRDGVKNEANIYKVSYHEKHCYFYLKRKSNNLLFDGNWSYRLKSIEVIGNIYDNPELMGDQP